MGKVKVFPTDVISYTHIVELVGIAGIRVFFFAEYFGIAGLEHFLRSDLADDLTLVDALAFF